MALSGGFNGSFLDFLGLYIGNYSGLGSGPLWFVEALLIFTGVYVLWRRLARNTNIGNNIESNRESNKESKIPGNKIIAIFALILGIVTFTVRIWLPMLWNFELLNFQIPFFPQYIVMFIIGIIACRGNWFLQIPEKTGKLWSLIAALLILLFPILLVLYVYSGDPARFTGGLYWQAFTYALWEQFLGVSSIIALSVLFREKYNNQGKLAKAMSASAYTAYIIHAPIIVFMAIGLRGLVLPPVLKFVLVAPPAVVLVFLVSNYIRKLPMAKRIL